MADRIGDSLSEVLRALNKRGEEIVSPENIERVRLELNRLQGEVFGSEIEETTGGNLYLADKFGIVGKPKAEVVDLSPLLNTYLITRFR